MEKSRQKLSPWLLIVFDTNFRIHLFISDLQFQGKVPQETR